jgi:low affinity Fe/Cu permease
MDTRRLYISSSDTVTKINPNNSKITIDYRTANIERKSNEILALSLIKCSFASSVASVPNTTVTSTIHEDNCSILSFTIGAVTHNIYFNQNDTSLNTGANNTFAKLSLNTRSDQLLEILNTASTGLFELNSANQLAVKTATTVIFLKTSTPSLLTAVGVHTDKDTTMNLTTSAPYSFNVASICPVVYIKIDELIETFLSNNRGSYVNILGSVPVVIDSTINGTQDLSVTNPDNSTTFYETPSQINYTNHSVSGSHKPIGGKSITRLELEIVNTELQPLALNGTDYSLVVEVKTVKVQS